MTKVQEQFRFLKRDELFESPLNTRRHFDPVGLEELAASIRASGVMEALVVRPNQNGKGKYEIASGHRRFRAAAMAGVDELPVRVLELDDAAFVEILTISNLQRDDLHPLEEAEGFRTLMERAGYDVAKIAARIGKSTRYVYDSITLLKLIPPAKKLFLAGAFQRGHAIELARLSKADQERALDSGEDRFGVHGLFEPEHAGGTDDELDLDDERTPRKPVSVREFKHWIDNRVRLTPKEADPVLFPDTAAAAQTATPRGKARAVEITYHHVAPAEARDPGLYPDAPRILGAQAWKSATPGIPSPGQFGDEKPDGKACEHSITGFVVIGCRRGETFQVCVAKETCSTHWGQWQKERAKRRREHAAHPSGASSAGGGDDQPARKVKELPPWLYLDVVEQCVRDDVIPGRVNAGLAKQVLACGLPKLAPSAAVALGYEAWRTIIGGDGLSRAKHGKGPGIDNAVDAGAFDMAWTEALGPLLPGKPKGWDLSTVEQCRSAIALSIWLVTAAPSNAELEKEAVALLKAEHQQDEKEAAKAKPKTKAKKKGGR